MRRPGPDRTCTAAPRRGFTLVELLVVILIILLVSAVTLPTVISAFNHREVSEAARILQGGLVGARDAAINTNAPAGIRLLPDPVFNGVNPATGVIDPRRVLASNRFVPIQLAPDYTEGRVTVLPSVTLVPYNGVPDANAFFPYPSSKGGGFYPAGSNAMLYLVQQVANEVPPYELNPPTSWYWNIRVGDRIQINNSGAWYTVVGPMTKDNPEAFVNVGDPGTVPPLLQVINGINYNPEILFLVNGVDDDHDGFIDNGFDGVDNDGDGIADQVGPPFNTLHALNEWTEIEAWQPALRSSARNVPYTIARRPVVAPGARETLLPGNVVVDLTYAPGFARERSRLPVDLSTGYVDILLYPNGTVVPTTAYSSFSSFGMDSAFYHFWLAERSDLYPIRIDPTSGATVPYSGGSPAFQFLLPMPYGAPYQTMSSFTANYYDTLVASTPELPVLKGETRLLSLNTRTGQMTVSTNPPFNVANPNQPFVQAQQGARGGQ